MKNPFKKTEKPEETKVPPSVPAPETIVVTVGYVFKGKIYVTKEEAINAMREEKLESFLHRIIPGGGYDMYYSYYRIGARQAIQKHFPEIKEIMEATIQVED